MCKKMTSKTSLSQKFMFILHERFPCKSTFYTLQTKYKMWLYTISHYGEMEDHIPRLAPQVASLEFHFYLIYVVKTSRAGASLACTEPFSFLAGKGGKA